MSVDACARIVQAGDPDRFLAAMAAPPAARGPLLVLYAFNLEVARAPWVTAEPLIARMRLQFWHDVLDDPAPRAHEVAGPLHALLAGGVDRQVLHDLVTARESDADRAGPADQAALDVYLSASAGGLMWAAGQALGAPRAAEAGLRSLGRAQGLARYLQAVPELQARRLRPLPDASPESVAALARGGLDQLGAARAGRGTFGPGTPAALAAWMTRPLLTRAAQAPGSVAQGALHLSEFHRRGRLLWVAATGRF